MELTCDRKTQIMGETEKLNWERKFVGNWKTSENYVFRLFYNDSKYKIGGMNLCFKAYIEFERGTYNLRGS